MKGRIVAIIGALLLPSVALAQTHCAKNEITYFSCATTVRHKVLSVCGNIGSEGILKDSWLQYRFGRIGSIELVYPKEKPGSVEKFEGTYFVKYGGVSLRFVHEKALYDVVQQEEVELDGEKIPHWDGVAVALSNGKHVKMSCQSIDPQRYLNDSGRRGAVDGVGFMLLANFLREHNGDTDFQSLFANKYLK